MSQSPRLRSPHEQSAHIEPVMGPIRHRCTSTPTAIASPQFSPPQSHGHTSNSQQEGINFTESVKIREENHRAPDNPQTVKHKSQVEQDPRHDEVEQLEPLRRSPVCYSHIVHNHVLLNVSHNSLSPHPPTYTHTHTHTCTHTHTH